MSTKEQRLAAVLRALVESYDDTGCDGCGVISQSAYEDAQTVLASVGSADASEPRVDAPGHSDDARWVDPFEIVDSLTSLPNDPVDW